MVNGPKATKLKILISYSRADEAFADEVRLGLEDKGFAVEIDKHSIRQGEEWKTRLRQLIRACDTVVFILSPDSARSPICHWEVEEAHTQSKRINSVLYRALEEPARTKQPDGTPWSAGTANLPERLTLINYPRFDGGRSFMAGLRGLAQALEDDLEWIDANNRLSNRARDWDDGGRATNRLLAGADIGAARRLVEARKSSAPAILPVQLDFIQASEAHEAAQKTDREREADEKRRLAEMALTQSRKVERRTRLGLAISTTLLLLLSGAVGVAWMQYRVIESVHVTISEQRSELPKLKADAEKVAFMVDEIWPRVGALVRLATDLQQADSLDRDSAYSLSQFLQEQHSRTKSEFTEMRANIELLERGFAAVEQLAGAMREQEPRPELARQFARFGERWQEARAFYEQRINELRRRRAVKIIHYSHADNSAEKSRGIQQVIAALQEGGFAVEEWQVRSGATDLQAAEQVARDFGLPDVQRLLDIAVIAHPNSAELYADMKGVMEKAGFTVPAPQSLEIAPTKKDVLAGGGGSFKVENVILISDLTR